MSNRVRIVSDGEVRGTKVLMPDGAPVPGVVAIEILPLRAGVGSGAVQARVTLNMVALDVTAEMQRARVQSARSEPGPELVNFGQASRVCAAGDTRKALAELRQVHDKAQNA